MISGVAEIEIQPGEGCLSSARREVGTKIRAGGILLVDDELPILTVLAWNMNELGLRVTTALGGQAALKKLGEEHFELLITDLVMGDLDGLFLARIAKALNPEMKIVLMTGSPDLVPRSSSCRSCFDALLEKPFNLSEFKEVITRFIRLSRSSS